MNFKIMSDKSNWKIRDRWLLSLISKLFWLFFFATLVYIGYTMFAPTTAEWHAVAGNAEFPNNFSLSNLARGIERHVALWQEHITGSFLIGVINLVFLMIFVRTIITTVEESMGTDGKGTVEMFRYVEWAMGSLVSGILYFASTVAGSSVEYAVVYVVAIVVFAAVANYILYEFRNKLKLMADKEKQKQKDKEVP